MHAATEENGIFRTALTFCKETIVDSETRHLDCQKTLKELAYLSNAEEGRRFGKFLKQFF